MWARVAFVVVALAVQLVAAANRSCQDGLLVPAWRPLTGLSLVDTIFRGFVYFVLMLYLFIGVSIISDRFMSAIEVITSQEKKVTIRSRGEKKTVSVRVWNETVANLTLMALGSSAPEILLSIIEIWGKGFQAGELGPGTIVGSAAYNLFVIIAICVSVIPNNETRKIKQLNVFFVTSAMSVFAYVWLYMILEVFSRGVVEVWEGILTFMFFPITVFTAYMADKKVSIYKLPLMLFRVKSRRAVAAAESVDIEMTRTEVGGFEEMLEHARQQSAQVLKELRRQYPEKTLAELKVIAQDKIEQSGPKSRAFYRIQATRTLTGGSISQRSVRETIIDDTESTVGIFDDATYVRFDQSELSVMENIGNLIVKVVLEGPGSNVPLLVDYQSEDGTANAGSDYMAVSGTLIFTPGQQEQFFKIKIIDDDVFEEDEHFLLRLSNPRPQGAKASGPTGFKLGEPSSLKVTILDDDHSGIFGFASKQVEVSECAGVVEAVVERKAGARGRVSLPYATRDGTALAGRDYHPVSGSLLFDNNEFRKTIPIKIISLNCYERNSMLTIHLENPIMETNEEQPRYPFNLSTRTEEEVKIAKEGFPSLGENSVMTIIVKESLEFKDTVDQLVESRSSPFVIGTRSWGEQFSAAMKVKEDCEDGEPSSFDYFIHILTVFWKLIFAFVPPTDFCNGYLCFTLSIVCIGLLTAIIGDIASHFGCTVGLEDAVTAITFVALGTSVPAFLHGWISFTVSILWIGVLTTVIGDMAAAFGCTVGIEDQLTAISLVAMGTSLPDTFASKVAAIQDSTADNSVGNVTGSNAVNVFLGIGVAWSLAAIYHAMNNNKFFVDPGNLAFSVTLFCTEALIAITIILCRRCKLVGGELGGPTCLKYTTSFIFFSLWIIYLTMSTLEVYGVLKMF